MTHEELTAAMRTLAERLTPGDLDETLHGITAAAVEVLRDVDFASITVRHADGRLETAAPTDELIRPVDEAQYEFGEGPCYDCATDTVHLIASRLAEDDRFPRYRKVALDAGIQASAAIRLFESRTSLGALNLYSYEARAFEDDDLGFLATLFAHQSAMALEYAREIQDLREAVQTRQVIGQAIGITMQRYELNEQRAFAFLARLSQRTNVKLREVARAIVEAGNARSD